MTNKEKAILKNMELLEISREEAEELYAFDNDEIENEEVEKIEQKVTDQTKVAKGRSSLEKVKHMKAKKKSDVHKEAIIKRVFTDTASSELVHQPQEMTATKMSFMDADGGFYTVQVTKHKNQPDGYTFEEETTEESQ